MKTTLLGCLVAASALAAEPQAKNVLALKTTWAAEDGKRLSLEAFKGRWYALTFIYTSCAGSCPLTTKKLKRLDAALEKAGKPLELAVVSLDPTHDTPEQVKQYRARYQLEQASRWRILVGDDAQVRTLTMLLEFKYTKNPESGVILHDNTVFLVAPDGSVKTSMSSLDQPMDDFIAAVPSRPAPAARAPSR
jgi:protein SCO1/2